MNNLSALLFDRAQLDEITARRETGFLLELANGGRYHCFVLLNLAFRNAPLSLLFVFEQRPAGMREKNLQLPLAHPIHQQPGADFVLIGHRALRFWYLRPRESISLLSIRKIAKAMREPMNGQPIAGAAEPHLLRRFGLLQATALNMTNIIGIGPFITIPAL